MCALLQQIYNFRLLLEQLMYFFSANVNKAEGIFCKNVKISKNMEELYTL